MDHAAFQNVFRGPDAVAQFFNPDNSPPVPLVEIPDKLNPFRKDGVRIYAKMLTALPGQNVKALPGQYEADAVSNAPYTSDLRDCQP